MDIDTMINNALGTNGGNTLDLYNDDCNVSSAVNEVSDIKKNIDSVVTNNLVCKTLDALGYLDMKETKAVAKTLYENALIKDIVKSRVNYVDKLNKVFKLFMKSRYGGRFKVNDFKYYYLYFGGTKVSLTDLVQLDGMDKSSNLGKIIGVLDSINMGLSNINTKGIKICDVYGNNLALQNIIKNL